MSPQPRNEPPKSFLLLYVWLACIGDAFASPAAAVAVRASGGSYLWELLAILLPLAFIIICLLVLLRFLRRRFGLVGNDAPLSVVQVLPVGPRERIVVVRSRGGRAFAVGVSANAVNLITTLDGEDLVTVPADVQSEPPPAGAITTGQR